MTKESVLSTSSSTYDDVNHAAMFLQAAGFWIDWFRTVPRRQDILTLDIGHDQVVYWLTHSFVSSLHYTRCIFLAISLSPVASLLANIHFLDLKLFLLYSCCFFLHVPSLHAYWQNDDTAGFCRMKTWIFVRILFSVLNPFTI